MGGMWVVLDTTVFRDENENLDALTLKAIRSGRAGLLYKVAIPEVVVRESSRQLREYTRGLWNKGTDHLTRYASRAGLKRTDVFDPDRLEADLAGQQTAYRARLEGDYDRILPLPSVEMEELVHRAVEYMKPFDRKGRGLRDYLIWKSILSLRQKTATRIVFVTRNSSDFSHNGKLAPDLQADVEALGAPPGAVTVVQDVETFISETLQPSFDKTDDAKGNPFIEVFGENLERSVLRLLDERVSEWAGWSSLAAEAALGSDAETALDVEPILAYDLRVGEVARVLALPTDEKLVDISVYWTIIGEMDNRRRPDDPFDYVEVAWKGQARLLLDSKEEAADLTLLQLTAPEVFELSGEGDQELGWYNDSIMARAEETEERTA